MYIYIYADDDYENLYSLINNIIKYGNTDQPCKSIKLIVYT